jgi:PAS domain S-box-containing protein
LKTDRTQESGFRIDTFFEMTPDLVCIAGKDGYFRKINRAVVEKLGYTEQELMSQPVSTFMHPDDRQQTLRQREDLLAGKNLVNFRNRYLTKSGATIWLEWTSIYFPDNEEVFAIAKEVTERKKLEVEIEEAYKKFKSLATHFKSSMEEDRKYLARELHEELAQLASVLKTDIDYVRNHEYKLTPAAKGRLENAWKVSDLLITTLRRLSFSISPNMLDHLGLDATLDWYCREFSILNGIPCSFQTAYDEARLNGEVRIDLFRICQESLNNVLNHSEAGEVKITIEDLGDCIEMAIQDDGKGFDPLLLERQPGLTRMRERAASINAGLIIHSEPGKGTRIWVRIPNR